MTNSTTTESKPEESIFFSPSQRNFLLGRHYEKFAASGTWPIDAKKVTFEEFQTYAASPPEGKVRGCDANGNPAWVDAPPLSANQSISKLNGLVTQALNKLARDWGYTNGIDNATTWSTSSNPQYAAEGKALARYRDQVWEWVESQPEGTSSLDGMPATPVRPTVSN